MELNQPVRVRLQFNGHWAAGFAISRKVVDDDETTLFELTRLSDGAVLPTLFAEPDVRPT